MLQGNAGESLAQREIPHGRYSCSVGGQGEHLISAQDKPSGRTRKSGDPDVDYGHYFCGAVGGGTGKSIRGSCAPSGQHPPRSAPGLQPPGDAVEVEGVVADAPGHRALLAGVGALVRLA